MGTTPKSTLRGVNGDREIGNKDELLSVVGGVPATHGAKPLSDEAEPLAGTATITMPPPPTEEAWEEDEADAQVRLLPPLRPAEHRPKPRTKRWNGTMRSKGRKSSTIRSACTCAR